MGFIYIYCDGRGRGSRWKGEDSVVVIKYIYIYIYFKGKGQRELVGVKTGNDIVCCDLKEEAGGSRWVRRRGMRWVMFHKVKMCLFKMNGTICLSLM